MLTANVDIVSFILRNQFKIKDAGKMNRTLDFSGAPERVAKLVTTEPWVRVRIAGEGGRHGVGLS